ncbi:MAG: hypothetical protein ONA69_05960, partial [candidate division KSB1 bacterium]|nr:hypothetical protein [candidate division KSB1 bacterium]
GAVFLIAAIVLLISYDTRYEQAVGLQRLYAALILLFGGWEYLHLLRNRTHKAVGLGDQSIT